MNLESTITVTDAETSLWDAIVIGAGPAGAVASQRLANGGRRVLLIDAKKFPREKVCGGCINSVALSVLNRIGLADLIVELPASTIREYVLHLRGRTLRIATKGGIAISRAALDSALVQAAMRAGVSFLGETTARLFPIPSNHVRGSGISVEEFREVELEVGGHPVSRVRGRVIVIADGVARKSLQHTSEFPVQTAVNSWIGLHCTYPGSPDDCAIGQVHMHIGRGGYVGTVRIENNTINLAAAVAPAELKHCGTPEAVVSRIFETAGVVAPIGISDFNWQGTGPLTRQSRRVGGERVMIVGDTAGYVEPFTGEGVGNAVRGAVMLTDILLSSDQIWDPKMAAVWNNKYRREIAGGQWICRALAAGLHHPRLAEAVFRLALRLPRIPQTVANLLSNANQFKRMETVACSPRRSRNSQ